MGIEDIKDDWQASVQRFNNAIQKRAEETGLTKEYYFEF